MMPAIGSAFLRERIIIPKIAWIEALFLWLVASGLGLFQLLAERVNNNDMHAGFA